MNAKVLKSGFILLVLTLLMISFNFNTVFAQKGGGGNKKSMHDNVRQAKDSTGGAFKALRLSAEQKKSMLEARTKFLKQVTPLRNQVREKAAHLKTLSQVDKPDMNAINATIDEISSLRNQIMKLAVTHKLIIRGMLNDDQKAIFDAKKDWFGKGKGKGRNKQRPARNNDSY